MIRKIFTKKNEPAPTIEYADHVKMMLDALRSDLALGIITEREYRDLCMTVNDGALERAEKLLGELENYDAERKN